MCEVGGCLGGMSLGGFLLSIGLAALGLLLLGFLVANVVGLVTLARRFRFNPVGAFTLKAPTPPKPASAEKKGSGVLGPLLLLIVGASAIGALVALTIALLNGGL